jgi:pSer/pThr/pTyr-binding forkhead associated (FHA) protein
MAGDPKPATARELQAVLHAERACVPFLLYRDPDGDQRIVALDPDLERLTLGRSSSNDVVLEWDEQVSRAHAELERVGSEWTVSDDGLSRNGTYVNGARLTGRRRLGDGDLIVLGLTRVLFRAPERASAVRTAIGDTPPTVDTLTDTQRRILIALCRPYRDSEFATPATNQSIANEVFLSVDAVKTHLRVLYDKFQLTSLPQTQKRVRLVEYALTWGLVAEREL